MTLPAQHEQYQAMFHRLMQSRYKGVPGIIEVKGARPGPTAAILVCVHGNEPAGLGAMEYLLSDLQLQKGRLLCILVNFAAAQRYFCAETDAEREAARYIDRNMNRLPPRGDAWTGTVEGIRIGQLWPILQEIDGGVLDIHSTSAEAPAMLIAVDGAGCEVANCPNVPFDHVIVGIHECIEGKFVIEVCDQAKLKLLAECGQHHCPEAADRAIAMSLAFLQKLEMIPPPFTPPEQKRQKHCYRVQRAVHLPEGQAGFRLLAPITPFEWVEQGQAIACNGSEQMTAPQSGYAIMCPRTEGELSGGEALLFLCERR